MFSSKKRDRAHKEGVNLGRLLENRDSLEEIQRKTRIEEGVRGEKSCHARHGDQWLVDYHKSVSTMLRRQVYSLLAGQSAPALTFTTSLCFRREFDSL